MTIRPASDRSLLISFGARISDEAHRQVSLLCHRMAGVRGILNLHPAFASVLIDFDPRLRSHGEIEGLVRARLADAAAGAAAACAAAADAGADDARWGRRAQGAPRLPTCGDATDVDAAAGAAATGESYRPGGAAGGAEADGAESAEAAWDPPRLVEIPVCYGGEFGPDLEDVARHCGLDPARVVELHAAADYLVYFVGFSTCFPYLGGLPASLATPRLSAPRKHVPEGSVAIGGSQAGVYPLASPGGWRLIGRTPLRLFDPQASPPGLLRMDDRVRFRPVPKERF
ncbi:MAG: 5-oxoprolinase subunit PxpB [Bryobacteraceae bacterium]